MSLIEGDAYFPLFSTSEIPIDFSAAGLVPDSPGKLVPFTRRPSFTLSNSQAVPGGSMQCGGAFDESIFNMFMNNADKMDINAMKAMQMPEDLLMQASVVPDFRPKMEAMGMDQRQFAQMGMLPSDAMANGDFNMVPQLPTSGAGKPSSDDNAKGKKRKFVQNPAKGDAGVLALPPIPEGQLSPEEERNMKRQRRLVKNREAAQLFRQRQKAYIQDLEKKVSDLSSTNNDFRARVELLNSENKLIKEQLLYLRNFITQAVSFQFPKSPGSEGEAMSPASLLGPLPPGLTLPPEVLGAMGNMPNMLGLMGAMGSAIPGLTLPPNFAEAFGSAPSTPSSPHTESHSIKLSPVAGGAALIPPPTKLNNSHNGTAAVVPQFTPSSPMMVPDGADSIKVPRFDSQGNMVHTH